ncbi:Uma2 family endonuclease [Microcoleus sp. A003_D6]|uniref:Uma2 family endonuclease n=1 Tax=Microcoleus sp. A003_D6 TaxID=3055266 RepID=UPI002FD28E48
MLITEAPFTLRKWTVKEYQKLGEMGFFHPEERVELIEGNIIKMSAKGTAHTSATRRTATLLRHLLENQAAVYTQDPIALDDSSEPEPDIAVVRIDPFDYATHHPTPSEIYLIIEVADSSLAYDREIKAKIYARSGIADYWVLNVGDRQLHVFREPTENGYQSELILGETASISPLQFPAFNIAIQAMLPPLV